jgi:alpha-glucosidase (family GH31 glycosyl hydrolase)
LYSVALTKLGAPFPPYHLGIGGYRRGLDGVDGSASTSPGLLYQDGWCLLDDTLTAIFDSPTGAVTQRPTGARTYQDGYLFVYGTNYQQALRDLHDLTGPALMLPHWAYGVWFSRYYAYSASDYENTLLPAFRTEQDPLDVLVSDTDWKAPNHWDGWEVNSQYFPAPQAYFTWAHQQGLHTSFNIHPSISSSDPAFPQAQATAQGGLMLNGGNFIFNWGAPDQLTAYFNLHYPIEADGLDIWWLDWCCNNSYANINITPDSWIDYNYAKETSRGGRRGFALSRAFSSLEAGGAYGSVPLPTGPWADHRYTVHFTGDAYSDFGTLKYEVGYTPAEEAATGLTYTSHDLGGFHGDLLPDDLYVRWVQFGTFQPIFRLHSDHGNRLPWDYSGPARTAANKFLQLREELIPYTYTAARQAYDTGLPIVRALYLALPDQPNAYLYSGTEYYFGDNLLIAPATASGTTATTQVWLPPGNWLNYFTGQISNGSSLQSITTDWNSMPVFIKAGGIVPQRTNNVANDVQNPLTEVTINVGAGDSGSYALYEDDGDGYGFKEHAFAMTPIAYREPFGQRQLRIGRPIGHFSHQVMNRQWTARFIGVHSPSQVSVDRRAIAPSSSGPGWSYDLSTLTLIVRLPSLPSSKSVTISAREQVDAGSPGSGRAKLRLNRGP